MTPLEPRLVKKLLPPLTSIIRTTPAMSLLYECINGIIQGGILGGTDDDSEDEIATLCVTKLRGMIMVEGDPNREYPPFVEYEPVLTIPSEIRRIVSLQPDCIDSPISRITARRCYNGLYRQSRYVHQTASTRSSCGDGQQR
jgi:AP-3 complex subunit delta-1